MEKFYDNNILLKLEQGFIRDGLFLYTKNKYLYVIKNDVRLFKVSFKRLVKTIYNSIYNILYIIINKSNKIYLDEEIENNKVFLIIQYYSKSYKMPFNYKIKLKEINEYLKITAFDKPDDIINKQNEKIILLLKKIEYHENKYREINTDDEFI